MQTQPDQAAVGRKPPSWNECEHDWQERSGDYDLGGNRQEVVCVKCQCPGERDLTDGEVFWPAT